MVKIHHEVAHSDQGDTYYHEDVKKVVEAGVHQIVVSSHGARQLYNTTATISVLEEPGTDVFESLALGAQVVLVGRPIIYGLAIKGQHGVKSVIEMLKHALEFTMALYGCLTLEHIKKNRVNVMTQNENLHAKL
ncbi:FMN-dependent dehydrogenase [Parasponia andersonii]|uniref:FMN-dependent dehydrogenase n=1 Tax=Parasponia andersonii TaxID=3476 RepID=A0A2P5B490_PARAD|nr:FMN-dependent dehydrogenase [Parasponia andersonii]